MVSKQLGPKKITHVGAKGINTNGAKENNTWGGTVFYYMSWPMDFKYGMPEIEGKGVGFRLPPLFLYRG